MQFYQRFLVLQLGGLIFLKGVIGNKLLHVKNLISFLFTRFYYHIAHSLVRGMVLKARE